MANSHPKVIPHPPIWGWISALVLNFEEVIVMQGDVRHQKIWKMTKVSMNFVSLGVNVN